MALRFRRTTSAPSTFAVAKVDKVNSNPKPGVMLNEEADSKAAIKSTLAKPPRPISNTIPKELEDFHDAKQLYIPEGTRWVLTEKDTFDDDKEHWLMILPRPRHLKKTTPIGIIHREGLDPQAKNVFHTLTKFADWTPEYEYDDASVATLLAELTALPSKQRNPLCRSNKSFSAQELKKSRPGFGRAAAVSDGSRLYLLAQNQRYLLAGGHYHPILGDRGASGNAFLTAYDIIPPEGALVLQNLPLEVFYRYQRRPHEGSLRLRRKREDGEKGKALLKKKKTDTQDEHVLQKDCSIEQLDELQGKCIEVMLTQVARLDDIQEWREELRKSTSKNTSVVDGTFATTATDA